MRVKNKELRQRRHRKEQTIKDAIREAKKGGAKTEKAEKKVVAPAAEKPAAPRKAAAPKKVEAEKKPAAKKATKKAEPEAAAE